MTMFGRQQPARQQPAREQPARERAEISSYEPTLRDRLRYAAGDIVGALGGGRYAQQDAGKAVSDLADFVPGLGDVLGAGDLKKDLETGQYKSAALEALALGAGLVPVVGDVVAKRIRGAKQAKSLVSLSAGSHSPPVQLRPPVQPASAVPLRPQVGPHVAAHGVDHNVAGKAGKPAQSLASRSPRLSAPPAKPARDFALDYPAGAPADASGKLRTDIEGRPLVAKYVVGRQSVGEADRALGYDEVVATANHFTKEGIRRVAPSTIGGDAGRVALDRRSRAPLRVDIDRGLNEVQARRVLGHEVGHVIDELAGQIPTDGLSRELAPLYNTLATGEERVRHLTGPQHFGYRKKEVPRENMAEALRAYIADPNFLKTVAPKTAARIREFVNSNPRLMDTIQFNAPVGATLGAGVLGYEMLQADQDQGIR